jgi:hypothetical protein
MSTEQMPTDRAGAAHLQERVATLEMQPDVFRAVGHALVDPWRTSSLRCPRGR